jgi:FlaA1/EpsC-like NDP-sugar epimerase
MFGKIKRRRAWKMVLDIICVYVAFMLALSIRFEMEVPLIYLRNMFIAMPGVAALFLLANWSTGIYRGRWKYASFDELVYLVAACGAGTAVLFAAVAASSVGRSYVPLSVTVMGGVLSLFAMGSARLVFRFLNERRMRTRPREGKTVLLVGAGEAGEMVARDMLRHPEAGYVPAGFVDDDPAKRNLVVQGVPVLGMRRDIPSLVRELGAEEVFITIPSARGSDIREIVGICEQTEAGIKILPGIFASLGEGAGLASVRELELEDLLGREPVETDLSSISSYVTDKRVMVTGAGGSIGSELCRQLAVLGPSELTLLDNDETALYELELELMALAPHRGVYAVVADIRDADRVNAVFKRFRPQVVFHSAAHKHVPIMEQHPSEAVKTNVLGTRNLALAALLQETERFILISTDKAVKPANVMGATKRVAEMMVKRLSGTGKTRFGAVRFGNVLGSRGSVVPTFRAQIERGGPVLITHPEATRYFMTIPEAAQLVIQAGAFTEGGEVFILDMGEPMLIRELAEKMISLMGRGRRIEVQICGLRPGEKLHEELVLPAEEMLPTPHPKISKVVADLELGRDFEEKVERLILAAVKDREVEIRQRLKEVVPSYEPAAERDRELPRVVELRRDAAEN